MSVCLSVCLLQELKALEDMHDSEVWFVMHAVRDLDRYTEAE
jgi:hypothetical protein